MDSNFLLPSAVALRRPPSELGEGTWLLWLARLLTIQSFYPLPTTFSCSNYQQAIHRKNAPFSSRPQNLERFVFCCSLYSKHGRGPAVRASADLGAIPVIIHWLLLLLGLYADRLVVCRRNRSNRLYRGFLCAYFHALCKLMSLFHAINGLYVCFLTVVSHRIATFDAWLQGVMVRSSASRRAPHSLLLV